MKYHHKNANLPMNVLLETIRQGGWHEHSYNYFDMANNNTTVFSNFHCPDSRDFYEYGYWMGHLHGQTHHHRDLAVRQPAATKVSRCVPPFFPGCFLDTKPVVENADVASGQDILSQRCYTDRSGRYAAICSMQHAKRSRLLNYQPPRI